MLPWRKVFTLFLLIMIQDKGHNLWKFGRHDLNRGVLEMNAVEVKESQEEIDYSEAAHVDEEYEYLLKNKDQGITFEEYCRRRGIKL